MGRNGDVSKGTREHAAKKLDKVLKFLEEPIDARLTFDIDGHQHKVEMHLAHRFGTLQAHSEAEGWSEARHRSARPALERGGGALHAQGPRTPERSQPPARCSSREMRADSRQTRIRLPPRIFVTSSSL